MKIYQLEEIEKVTSTPEFEGDLIDAIAAGFVSFSDGKFNAAPIQTLGAPPMGKFSCADDGGDDTARRLIQGIFRSSLHQERIHHRY